MVVHELKTDPEVFDAVARGEKTHEIRFNDRSFKVGDVLVLRRTQHTGQEMAGGAPLVYSDCEPVRRVVSHILTGYGLQPGWCILSFVADVHSVWLQSDSAGVKGCDAVVDRSPEMQGRSVDRSASLQGQADELSPEQFDMIVKALPCQPWGIGSRKLDALNLARAVFELARGVQGCDHA